MGDGWMDGIGIGMGGDKVGYDGYVRGVFVPWVVGFGAC